jgi:hypothetical protein
MSGRGSWKGSNRNRSEVEAVLSRCLPVELDSLAGNQAPVAVHLDVAVVGPTATGRLVGVKNTPSFPVLPQAYYCLDYGGSLVRPVRSSTLRGVSG